MKSIRMFLIKMAKWNECKKCGKKTHGAPICPYCGAVQ